MRKFLTFLTLLVTLPALAQDITNHAMPVGGGPGFVGWKTAGPCGVGQALIWSTGTGADPTCGTPFEISILTTGGNSDCATDNSAALTAALALLPADGGVVAFPVPTQASGCYAFASGIAVGDGTSSLPATKTNIKLVGKGTGSPGSSNVYVTSPISSVRLKYTGAGLVAAFLQFNGPGIFGLENIELDCNPTAAGGTSGGCTIGLSLKAVYASIFTNLSVQRFSTTGIRHDSYTTLPTGTFIGACRNYFANIVVASSGIAATVGLDLGFATSGGGNFDVCRDEWHTVDVIVANDTNSRGVILRGIDATSFYNLFTTSPGTAQAWGVFVIPPTGYTFLPHNISFYNSVLVGGVFTPADGTWTPRTGGIENQGLNFYPLQVGDMWNPALTQKPAPTNTFGGLSGFLSNGNPVAGVHVNAQVGTTYTMLSSDSNALVTFSNGSPIAVTLPQSTQFTSFGAGYRAYVQNKGAGTVTITPTTSTIDGAATLVLAQNQGAMIFADGAGNYSTLGIRGVVASVPSPLTLTASTGAVAWSGMSTDGILVASSATAVVTNRCTIDSNNSLNCASSGSNLPQFNMVNSTADAQASYFIFNKNRTGGNSLNGDKLGELLFGGFANAANRFAAQLRAQQTAASSGSNIPSSITLATSNTAGLLNQVFTFDSAGHTKVTPAAAPTLSAGCNGAGSSVAGSDTHGTATGQTAAATTCTLTFATAYAAVPDCVAVGLTSPLTGAITPATGTLVVNFASTANFKFTWHCLGG